MSEIHSYRADGFALVKNVFSANELRSITNAVEAIETDASGSMRSAETFAIRQVMLHAPPLRKLIWNEKMRTMIQQQLGENASVVKSIWFDKPPGGNWFVAYHQDISINV